MESAEPENETAPPTESEPAGDDAPISMDPVAEIRSLRAKNRILRAERTAIAGRKYVLETVVESLRQKLDELARAFAAVEAGGDIADAIKTVGTLVGDARRIAEDKEALEGELEAERKERLTERRSREAREFELEERAAGLAAERTVFVERIEALEAKVGELQDAGNQVEDMRRQLATATAELATAANELERAANDAENRSRELSDVRNAHEATLRVKDQLEVELATLRGNTDAVHAAKDEHVSKIEQLQMELESTRAERDGLNRSLISAQADHARALESAMADDARTSDNERKLREEMAATLETERKQMREALAGAEGVRQQLEAEKAALVKQIQESLAGGNANAKELDAAKAALADAQRTLTEQKPVLDALADRVDELEKEATKLATRLGEARDRGKVDVKELLVRAALLKRRAEREAAEAAAAAQKPITRAAKPAAPAPKPAAPKPAPGGPARPGPAAGPGRPPTKPVR